MKATRPQLVSSLLVFFLCHNLFLPHLQAQPSTEGFTCAVSQDAFPCQTYAFYRAMAPDLLDLNLIGDLFSVSRYKISKLSDISSSASPLVPEQPLLIPLICSCNNVNATFIISYANITYTIKPGDSFYHVSTGEFQNLTTYQSVEAVNPALNPNNLKIGEKVIFPIFCKCPDQRQLENQVNFLISYVFQPSDSLSLVASRFGVETQSLVDVNGDNIQTFETIFIPVKKLPNLAKPGVGSSMCSGETGRIDTVKRLELGLGIAGLLLVLVTGAWAYREGMWWSREMERDVEKQGLQCHGEEFGLKDLKVNLLADVSECLDKYRVFKIEELRAATEGFSDNCLIQDCVYKGSINWEAFAIKKMKWNASEELRILQKVNHGNLVQLEGFCIDPDNENCYLVYEYVENGSLHSWLHGNKTEKLDWKTRLRIAIDVANGLQYIHEHTRPKVVHKDIKSSNILLDSKRRAKIANFGLAKRGFNAITKHIYGTQGYIAPDYISDGLVSTKMDVFSFGVILLELVTGKEAIDEEGKFLWSRVNGILEGKEETKMNRVKAWMDEALLLEESCPMEGVVNVISVAIACLQKDPSKRPSMVDVAYALCKSDELFFNISGDGLLAPPVSAR